MNSVTTADGVVSISVMSRQQYCFTEAACRMHVHRSGHVALMTIPSHTHGARVHPGVPIRSSWTAWLTGRRASSDAQP